MSNETNVEMPDFLKRTETEAQAEARRAKQKPKDESKGLKVVTPLDPKVSAAIAKDFVEKGVKAQQAVDNVIATATAKPPKKAADAGGDVALVGKGKPPKGKKPVGKKETALREQREAKAGKKVSPVLAKALKARDELNAKAAAAKSAKPVATAKPTKKKSASGPRRSNGKYDWDAALALAKSGKLPPLPPFNSYKSHMEAFYDLAKKKDLAGIKKLSGEYVNKTGARENMFRFVGLLTMALDK